MQMVLMDTNEGVEVDTLEALTDEVRAWCDAAEMCEDDADEVIAAAAVAWSAAEDTTLVTGDDGSPVLWLEV